MRDQHQDPVALAEIAETEPVYRSHLTGKPVTLAERIAAARVRVAIGPRRGVETPEWIVELSKQTL